MARAAENKSVFQTSKKYVEPDFSRLKFTDVSFWKRPLSTFLQLKTFTAPASSEDAFKLQTMKFW